MQSPLPIRQPTQQLPSGSPFKSTISFILNSSITVKALCVSVLIGYLLTFIDKSMLYLCVVPGKLMPPTFFLWTLITHGFIENELLQMLIDMFVILLYCKMLEPLWGTIEIVKFYFIVTIIVSVETTLLYFIIYTVTFKEVLIFNTMIHGLSGFIGGFSVAIKQIMPDTILLNIGIIRLKQDDLPLLFLLVSSLFYLIRLIDFTFLVMLSFGVLTSWVYLRFFQVHKNGIKGDSSTTFSFASFFPSIIQPFVAVISNTIFDILVRVKICTKPPKRYNISTTTQISLNINSTQSLEAVDAERRRQKALKALKERLNKTEKDDAGNSQWGNDDLTRKLLNEEHAIDEQSILFPANKSNASTSTTDTKKNESDSLVNASGGDANKASESVVLDLNNK